MSISGYEILLIILLMAIMVLGYRSHIVYISRIARHVKETTNEGFSRKDLVNALRISQGSNFNIVMIFSWCLFIVALAFLCFLTPTVFPEWNFFKFSQFSSGDFGLAVFGVAVLLIFGIFISIHIPRSYSCYLIPHNSKAIYLLTPIFLIGSIMSSIHLATIYPQRSIEYWIIGYAGILLSLILLISPIIKGLREEMRS